MSRRAANLLMLALALWGAPCAMAKPVMVLRASPPDPYPSGYDEWIADAELTAKYHGLRWTNGAYTTNADEIVNYGQYEPWYGYLRLAQHLGGDTDLESYANASCSEWRDDYSIANSGGVTGFRNYTDGLRLDWAENADTTSRDALIDQAVSASFTALTTPAGNSQSEFYSREIAYAALGYINSEVYCGTAHNARLMPYIDLILGDVDDDVTINGNTANLDAGGHIEQWLGTLTTDSDGNVTGGTHNFADGGWSGSGIGDGTEQGFAPFMGAITGWTLIAHYEHAAQINGGIAPDARIVPKLVRLFDGMWPYYWVEADAAMKLRWVDTDGATALNNEMAPIYWWLYKQTGDIRHLERGDALFNGTLGYESLTYRNAGVPEPSSYLNKEFNELVRWTIDGLEWRAEGVALHGD